MPLSIAGARTALLHGPTVETKPTDIGDLFALTPDLSGTINRAYCVRLKRWTRLEVPPWSPEWSACVAYVCGSVEEFSDLRDKAFQQCE